MVGRPSLPGGRHRVSLTGKSLGSEKLGRAGQFGAESLRLAFEGIGVLGPALHDRSLAPLFEFHYLELETHGMVFQTGIDHRVRAYPGDHSAKPARLLRRLALANSSADSRAVWTASSSDWRVDPMRSPASALAVAMAPLALVQ